MYENGNTSSFEHNHTHPTFAMTVTRCNAPDVEEVLRCINAGDMMP